MSDDSDIRELEAVAETLPKIMDAIVPKIGQLIRDLLRGLYSEVIGRELGGSVAAFYRSLVDAGVPQQMAESMTEEFMHAQKNLIADAIRAIQEQTQGPAFVHHDTHRND